MLHDPKEVLVELFELLENGSFSMVIFGILSHRDSLVDYSHDKGSVVFILGQNYGLFLPVTLVLHLYVVLDLDSTGPDQVILLVIRPVDLIDHFPHLEGAS